MVCEEDVLSWFKELESYKRVDVLCGLLNMCLPFELRFAGTYVEELGKRDFQELRGAELRANNPDELGGEIGGVGGDPRAPRRMALYVSLLRSCNAACARTLHKVLLGLERAGLLRAEPLDELLLLYTMALHHPAFTFDQRSHFGDILERLKVEDRRSRQQQPPPPPPQTPDEWTARNYHNPKVDRRPCPTCVQPPPTPTYRPPPVTFMYVKPGHMQGQPVGSDQVNDVNNVPVPVNAPPPGEPLMTVIHEGAPPPPFVQPYSMLEYGPGQGHWAEGGLVMPELLPPEMYNFPTQMSPMISQHASPCDSRPVSPNIQVPPPPMTPGGRVAGRQIQEAPPPMQQLSNEHHQQQQHQLVMNFNNINLNEMRLMEDEKLHDLGVCPDAVAQLRSIGKMNGMQRPTHGGKGAPQTYCFQARQRSSGSDSGSSTGSRSPPETPALAAPAPLGPGRPRQPSSPLYLQQPASYVQPHYQQRSVFPAAFASYRPNYTPFTANGEPPVYGAHYAAPYVTVPLYAQPKPSCWNCGTTGHSGNECKEPSIEEVTRAGGYQLDYSTAPPDINDK